MSYISRISDAANAGNRDEAWDALNTACELIGEKIMDAISEYPTEDLPIVAAVLLDISRTIGVHLGVEAQKLTRRIADLLAEEGDEDREVIDDGNDELPGQMSLFDSE